MKRKLICALIPALMLCSCGKAIPKSTSLELILKENSGITSQIGQKNDLQRRETNYGTYQDKLNYNDQHGIWLSYIDLNDMIYQKTEQEFRESFEQVCINCRSIDVNTLFVHCRAFGDALYKSQLFQRSKMLTQDYDPLEIMTQIAHENDLSVHAWINPFRCETGEYLENADSSFKIVDWYNKGDDRLKYVDTDSHYWLDPAYEEVRQLICDGVAEIIDNYDVDGIHFDDYFYPTTDTSFDETAFSASAETNLKKWRTDNINTMVKGVYDTIKEKNTNILFGISPQGNIDNNYNYMYADVAQWCSKSGYIDYILPQIYFGFENNTLPFETAANKWNDIVTNDDVSLYVGLAAYKIYSEDEYINNNDILSMQINYCRNLGNYSGYALYNYISLFPSEDDKALLAQNHLQGIKKSGGL